jgi:hypothetical protein
MLRRARDRGDLPVLVELAARIEAAVCVIETDLGRATATKAAERDALAQLRYAQFLLAVAFLEDAA